MTGENMLRAVSNEGILTLDGKNYSLGGLDGQPEFGYTQYKWLDRMEPFANSFRVIDLEPCISCQPCLMPGKKEA